MATRTAKKNFIIKYLKESIDELKKVVWPSKKQTIQHTIIVIALSLAIALYLGALDYLFNLILEYILTK